MHFHKYHGRPISISTFIGCNKKTILAKAPTCGLFYGMVTICDQLKCQSYQQTVLFIALFDMFFLSPGLAWCLGVVVIMVGWVGVLVVEVCVYVGGIIWKMKDVVSSGHFMSSSRIAYTSQAS